MYAIQEEIVESGLKQIIGYTDNCHLSDKDIMMTIGNSVQFHVLKNLNEIDSVSDDGTTKLLILNNEGLLTKISSDMKHSNNTISVTKDFNIEKKYTLIKVNVRQVIPDKFNMSGRISVFGENESRLRVINKITTNSNGVNFAIVDSYPAKCITGERKLLAVNLILALCDPVVLMKDVRFLPSMDIIIMCKGLGYDHVTSLWNVYGEKLGHSTFNNFFDAYHNSENEYIIKLK